MLRVARVPALSLIVSLFLTAAPGTSSEGAPAGVRVWTGAKAAKPSVRVYRFGVVSVAGHRRARLVGISRGRRPAPALGRAPAVRFGRHGPRRRHGVRLHFPRSAAFALPEQTLYPPYYRSRQPWTQRPGMEQRIEGGVTVQRGSPWRGRLKGGKTVEQGAEMRSHIAGGRTAKQGSPLRSRLVAGRTVRQGSPWASTMPNWTFRGHQSPMRPSGLSYYRTR